MRKNLFDVIAAGGGPGGSLAAYFLAKAGLRVAVIDAGTFPRPKACGGGLQAKAIASIPFDLKHLLRGSLDGISLTYGLRNPLMRSYPAPLVYGILRTEFDHYLLQQAALAGAQIFEGCPVREVIVNAHGPVTVHAGCEEFQAQCVIGADGANSIVRRVLNQRQDYFWQAGVYCEVPEEALNPDAFRRDRMIIDWGTLPSGYAWAFPKRGYLNVGAGGPIAIARHLKSYVARFIGATGLLRPGSAAKLSLVGHQLPTATGRTVLAGERVVLVGDAAGLVEPFTGDGITSACHSARMAADCIVEALNRGKLDLRHYHHEVTARIGAELVSSRKLLSLSVTFPKLIYRLFKSNDRVWNTFCKTLRGEETFQRLRREVLGPLQFAWKVIDAITEKREELVMRRSLAGQILENTAP
jgi:geranylgeranyl reductase family protein